MTQPLEVRRDDGLTKLHASGWCPRCLKEWISKTEAHCASCCSHFTSDAAFDKHLAPVRADEPCHDPAEVRNKKRRKVFERVPRVHGRVWRIRESRPHPFALGDDGARAEATNVASGDSASLTPGLSPPSPDGASQTGGE